MEPLTLEDIARHEAGHFAMAVAVGMPIRAVGFDAEGGFVLHEAYPDTVENAVLRILVVLGGLIELAETGDDLPSWPLDPEAGPYGERGDRRVLARIAQRFRMTEQQYNEIVQAALKLSCGAKYRQTVIAVSAMLEHRPVLDPDLLARLVAIAHREPAPTD